MENFPQEKINTQISRKKRLKPIYKTRLKCFLNMYRVIHFNDDVRSLLLYIICCVLNGIAMGTYMYANVYIYMYIVPKI